MKTWVAAFMALLALVLSGTASDLHSIHYPASTRRGDLQIPADFHVWIPPGVIRVKALIVHQHGCGEGAEESGETAALDLHWRALADKHDAALLSPHFRAGTNNCRLWCDPRNGSDKAFLRALADLGKQTGHPELESVPWCLWGHSGGGFWASLMLERHPERIVAMFCRSGSALTAWEKGEIPKPAYPKDAYTVPVIFNPGIKERGDARFNSAWEGTFKLFQDFRSKGAPVAFAPDPFSGHDCRNSRLMAIPFFDTCLQRRIDPMRERLIVLDNGSGFVGNWENGEVRAALGANNELSWLPDVATARAYSEYVKYGVTTDRTAPRKAPVLYSANLNPASREALLKWTAEPDLESGIRQFMIYRDGRLLAKVPEKLDNTTGFPQFQPITFHDTPPRNAPEMQYVDKNVSEGETPSYSIVMVNGVGLMSPKSQAVKVTR